MRGGLLDGRRFVPGGGGATAAATGGNDDDAFEPLPADARVAGGGSAFQQMVRLLPRFALESLHVHL